MIKINKTKVQDAFAKYIFIVCACMSIVAVFGIIGYILYASVPAFRDIGVFNFLFGTLWNHGLEDSDRWDITQIYGILPMFVNSIIVTVMSVVIGGAIAIFTACFMVFWCPDKFHLRYAGKNKAVAKFVAWFNKINLRSIFDQIIKLLAGIPSVIYGYFGLSVIVPILSAINGGNTGLGILACSLVLAIMILPTVASLTKNALEAVPEQYYEGALALGNTKAQAAFNVVVPAARSGIISALILGIGRAVGETMAVNMVSGGRALFPTGLFSFIRTLTTNIVMEMSEAKTGSTLESALFATGFVLLVLVLLINLSINLVPKEFKGKRGHKVLKGDANADIRFVKKGLVPEILKYVAIACGALIAFTLVYLIVFILVNGIPHITWNFLFGESTRTAPTLLPSFISTGYIILISLAIALPIGIGAAIYLSEYSKPGSKVVSVIRTFIDTLAGIPSIIFGLFGSLFFAGLLGGRCTLAGAFTMVLVILPTIIRSTEESLRAVPMSLREASYGLGAGKFRTIFKVVLPNAFAGIATATVLSIGRIVGESAALVYTAGMLRTTVPNALNPMNAAPTLTVFLYMCWAEPMAANPAMGVAEVGLNQAYATAVVLLVITVILNLLVYLIERHVKKKKG